VVNVCKHAVNVCELAAHAREHAAKVCELVVHACGCVVKPCEPVVNVWELCGECA
jgi:hypothetical protein